jgi:hypothetical protein
MATDQSISQKIAEKKSALANAESHVSHLEMILEVLKVNPIKRIGLGITVANDLVFGCELKHVDSWMQSYMHMAISASLERDNMLIRFAKEDLEKLESKLARLNP